ncbi:uncharacterized protein LOC129409190 [Boleophthalmus pectinirostris]|uniref:uncharacterized protein LOC129409190 n=1 Tax=Boleophthalmus pectinirostris TaxID=150288 RepID=UPI0024308BE9|nr:uncharacterized protein LOC129409190 [Boleophthalmus pectinirostris]
MPAAAENRSLMFSLGSCSLKSSWSIATLKPDEFVDDVFVCRENFIDSNSRFKAPCPAKDRENITFQITSPEPSDNGTYCLQERGKNCSCVPLDFNNNSKDQHNSTTDSPVNPWTSVGAVVGVSVGAVVGVVLLIVGGIFIYCYCKKKLICTKTRGNSAQGKTRKNESGTSEEMKELNKPDEERNQEETVINMEGGGRGGE